MNNNILDRKLSSFGVSIATGLMLESLFQPTTKRYDNDRVIPNEVNVNNYKMHIYNVYTLMRNIYASLPNKTMVMKGRDIMDLLEDELNIINSLYDGSKCTPVLYIPDYTSILKNMAVDKTTHITKGYLDYRDYYNILKSNKLTTDIQVLKAKLKLPTSTSRVLITTSYPIDLLNIKYINRLELIESNTGVVKTADKFYTKYHKIGKRDMSIFPFDERLLHILGDGKIIASMKVSIKLLLYNTAIDNKWNSKTKSFKLGNDMKQTDNVLGQLLNNYKSTF